jgi:hypothetical protein
MHKNNVKRCYPRSLELYNALPFKIKLKLGSNFDTKDLHKFYDALNKEEDLIANTEEVNDNELSNKEPKQNVNVREYESDNDSDDDELQEILNDVAQKSVEQKITNDEPQITNEVIINDKEVKEPKKPDKSEQLPFHMRLRNKVRFLYPK